MSVATRQLDVVWRRDEAECLKDAESHSLALSTQRCAEGMRLDCPQTISSPLAKPYSSGMGGQRRAGWMCSGVEAGCLGGPG